MDPKGYAPPLWQATFPCPPPSHDPNVVEKRIDNVRDEMGLYFDIAPLLRSCLFFFFFFSFFLFLFFFFFFLFFGVFRNVFKCFEMKLIIWRDERENIFI